METAAYTLFICDKAHIRQKLLNWAAAWQQACSGVPRERLRKDSEGPGNTVLPENQTLLAKQARADLRAVFSQTSGRANLPQSSAPTTEKPSDLRNAVRAPLRPPRPPLHPDTIKARDAKQGAGTSVRNVIWEWSCAYMVPNRDPGTKPIAVAPCQTGPTPRREIVLYKEMARDLMW
jgi:hypothetical protein